jgi:hypothetical protein
VIFRGGNFYRNSKNQNHYFPNATIFSLLVYSIIVTVRELYLIYSLLFTNFFCKKWHQHLQIIQLINFVVMMMVNKNWYIAIGEKFLSFPDEMLLL